MKISAAVLLLFISVTLTVSHAQQSQGNAQTPNTASISGHVVAADTTKPLDFAQVSLVTEKGRQLFARTDIQGRFEFLELEPGRYRLDVRMERYVSLQYGQRRATEPGKPIDLHAGDKFEQADFALSPTSSIEGTLLDEFGDGVPNVIVQIARQDFVAGRRRLMPVQSAIQPRPTDDRGYFRVYGLPPGDYYVSASSGAFVDEHESGGFSPTYYPGTTDPAEAKPVRIRDGLDATNISFGLVPANLARVSGTVLDTAGIPVEGLVILAPSDHAGAVGPIAARGTTDGHGKFSFRSVPPGTFVIQAYGRNSSRALGQAAFAWLLITTNGGDLTDLVLRTSNVSLRGRITFDDDRVARPRQGEVTVFPRPIEFDSAPLIGGGLPRSVIRDDWTFEVGNMSGLRVVRVETRSLDWTLQRVTMGGRDITDEPIDFRKGDLDGLEVVLTNHGASVSGTVVDSTGAKALTYAVVIYSTDSTRWAFPSRFVQLGRPNQEGRFRVEGLPPDNYLAVAVQDVEGSEWQDPAFLEKMRFTASPLALSEDANRTVDLKLASVR